MMDKITEKLSKLLGKIFLTKATFFGLDANKIVIVIGTSLKIYLITTKPKNLKNEIPFKENRELNLTELKNWAKDNNYEISFSTNNMTLRKILAKSLGYVMIEHKKNKIKDVHIEVMEDLEKSNLPESIKNWAKDNPEKFIANIEHIRELLKEK